MDNLYVRELATTLSKKEMYKIMVTDLMDASIEVNWREFNPYMSWFPNKMIDENMNGLVSRRMTVVKAMIRQQKKCFAKGKELNCFLDYLFSNAKNLSEDEVATLIWEPIIETSDTT